jgi:hypothetical protein
MNRHDNTRMNWSYGLFFIDLVLSVYDVWMMAAFVLG